GLVCDSLSDSMPFFCSSAGSSSAAPLFQTSRMQASAKKIFKTTLRDPIEEIPESKNVRLKCEANRFCPICCGKIGRATGTDSTCDRRRQLASVRLPLAAVICCQCALKT